MLLLLPACLSMMPPILLALVRFAPVAHAWLQTVLKPCQLASSRIGGQRVHAVCSSKGNSGLPDFSKPAVDFSRIIQLPCHSFVATSNAHEDLLGPCIFHFICNGPHFDCAIAVANSRVLILLHLPPSRPPGGMLHHAQRTKRPGDAIGAVKLKRQLWRSDGLA